MKIDTKDLLLKYILATQEPKTMTQIAKELGIRLPTVSRTIKKHAWAFNVERPKKRGNITFVSSKIKAFLPAK